MYGKIFESIYDGTLAEDWRALVTFQQMIVLCDPDGTLDITPASIARRTGIPIEHIKAGIEILESPDPYSRTPNNEGRRIIRIDEHRAWGWVIVNHNKYKNLRTANDRREYMRKYMRDKRNKPKVNESLQELTDINGKQLLTVLANTYADTDTNEDVIKTIKKRFTKPSIDEIREYCKSRNNNIDPEYFFDSNEAKGWVIGKTKTPMKNWKAVIRTWEKNQHETHKQTRKLSLTERVEKSEREFIETLDRTEREIHGEIVD